MKVWELSNLSRTFVSGCLSLGRICFQLPTDGRVLPALTTWLTSQRIVTQAPQHPRFRE